MFFCGPLLPHTKGQKRLSGDSYSSKAQWNPTEVFFLFPCPLHPSPPTGQDRRAGGTLSCRQNSNSAPICHQNYPPPVSPSIHPSSCFTPTSILRQSILYTFWQNKIQLYSSFSEPLQWAACSKTFFFRFETSNVWIKWNIPVFHRAFIWRQTGRRHHLLWDKQDVSKPGSTKTIHDTFKYLQLVIITLYWWAFLNSAQIEEVGEGSAILIKALLPHWEHIVFAEIMTCAWNHIRLKTASLCSKLSPATNFSLHSS